MIEIIVRGGPAPQGSKTRGANGSMRESSKAVRPWREAIRHETQDVMEERGLPPLTGPIYVRVWFILKRPASHYRTGRNAHLLRDSAPIRPASKRNDGDKLLRAVFDGLTDGGAWEDDGQAVDFRVGKYYAEPGRVPGCKIEITEVSE